MSRSSTQTGRGLGFLLAGWLTASAAASGQVATRPVASPIIDMHLHATQLASFKPFAGPAPVPHCVPMTDYPVPESGRQWPEVFRSRELPCHALQSAGTDEEVMERTLAIMERNNVYAVTSGSNLARWREAAPDRIIPSLAFQGGPDAPPVEELRKAIEGGDFAVFGEIAAQYGGIAPDDPSLEPYWSLMEELDIPAGIHIGTGPLGAAHVGFDRYRARLHSPLLLEEVLVRHPGLRVYIMHAGWPMLDDLLAVLWTHPHVYVDVGVICWALPRAEFHRYLRRIVEAGFAKRVLFGSDQMVWPDALKLAIESIESADFLTAEQKRDIFFNNAVRFLKLPPERVAAMQGSRSDPIANAIGEATMRDDKTIVVNLYRGSDCEGPFPRPHAQFVYPPPHPRYQRILEHIGGLKPGESTLVPPWPDDIDDARVEESVAAYLKDRRGWDEHSYEMCILGVGKDGSMSVSVYRPDPDDPKKQVWVSLVISKDDYEVKGETTPR